MATKFKVNYELKGDSSVPVTRTECIKHGSSMLDSVIEKKANASDVATGLSSKADITTVSALTSRTSANETNIATQTARIDNIVALPSGSTSGDAELADIRVGINGTTYSDAGTSVRSQISDVQSDAYIQGERSAIITGKNLVDFSSYFRKDGIYISGGIVSNSIEWWSTVLLPVKAGKTITIQPANVYYSFYKNAFDVPSLTNGQTIPSFISGGESSSDSVTVTVPTNAKYMVICTDTEQFENNHVQIEYGSTATSVSKFVSTNQYVENMNESLLDMGETVSNKLDAELGINIFDKNSSNNVKGYYFQYDNGVASVNADYTSYLIKVEGGKKLSFNNAALYAHVTFYSKYDEDINNFKASSSDYYISGFANQAKQGFSVPSNAVAMVVSVGYNYYDSLQIEYGDVSTSYHQYVVGIGIDKVIGYNVLWVGGNQKYKTISSAVNAASDNDVIIVTPGTYHESVHNTAKFLTIIGTSKDECILEYENGNYSNPPLEMAKGMIQNLTIHGIAQEQQSGAVAKAYCMHTDFNPEQNSSLYVENVRFINDDYQAVGIGLRPNYNLEFVNCEFICKSDYNAFYCHDCPTGSGINQNLIVRDCTFVNNGNTYTILLQSQEESGSVATCTFQRNIVLNKGESSHLIQMFLYNPSIGGGNYLNSTDWHLSDDSALNTLASINKF